jgi:hypothetical protein
MTNIKPNTTGQSKVYMTYSATSTLSDVFPPGERTTTPVLRTTVLYYCFNCTVQIAKGTPMHAKCKPILEHCSTLYQNAKYQYSSSKLQTVQQSTRVPVIRTRNIKRRTCGVLAPMWRHIRTWFGENRNVSQSLCLGWLWLSGYQFVAYCYESRISQ